MSWNSFEKCNLGSIDTFDPLARFLIEDLRLIAFGEECRILEIEFYLNVDHHPDPFVHCDEAQQTFAQWYLHRSGGTLKNGSFKGLDLTVGKQCSDKSGSHFGVLIRSIETPSEVICGPCLCVNYLIQRGGLDSIKALSNRIEQLDVRLSDTSVYLRASNSATESVTIYSCPRVGLSTKHETELHAKFGSRNYRYLIRPRAIKKGRPELIRGLGSHGFSAEEIRQITGSPRRAIEKYLKRTR